MRTSLSGSKGRRRAGGCSRWGRGLSAVGRVLVGGCCVCRVARLSGLAGLLVPGLWEGAALPQVPRRGVRSALGGEASRRWWQMLVVLSVLLLLLSPAPGR